MDQLNSHKGLALAHLNIRSLWRKLDSLKITLSDQFQIDILGISETWNTQNLDDSLISIKGYDILRVDRKWSDVNNDTVKKGGGVMLYISNKLQYTTRDLQMHDISSKNIECQWVRIVLEKQRNVIVGNLYRPWQGNVQDCIDYLENVTEQFDLTKEDLFIMGDFNIDFLTKSDNSYKLINEFCTQLGLDTCIKECTHFSQTKNSCLDQILSNSNFVSMSGVCNLNISDHQLVYVVRKKLKNIDKKISFWGRSFRSYDCHDFMNLLNNHDWTEILETECPNDIWKKLYDTILSLFYRLTMPFERIQN